MTTLKFSRLFRGNLRSTTCRIVLLTSVVWLIVDVVVLMRFSDYFSATGRRTGEFDVEVSEARNIKTLCIGCKI